MMLPKKKWSEPEKSKTMRAECSEAQLQKAADDYISYKHIESIRIPDWFFKWVKLSEKIFKQIASLILSGKWQFPEFVKTYILKTLQAKRFERIFECFGAKPDTILFIPISDKYSLALHLELKTQDTKGRAVGRLHGKQKREARKLPWQIARNTDKIIEIVDQFEKDGEKYKCAV